MDPQEQAIQGFWFVARFTAINSAVIAWIGALLTGVCLFMCQNYIRSAPDDPRYLKVLAVLVTALQVFSSIWELLVRPFPFLSTQAEADVRRDRDIPSRRHSSASEPLRPGPSSPAASLGSSLPPRAPASAPRSVPLSPPSSPHLTRRRRSSSTAD